MARLSDSDLQALLVGDATDVPDRLDAESRLHLDAYRAAVGALAVPPAPFAPGFADRVAAAVEARRAPLVRRDAFPWVLAAVTAAAALVAAVARPVARPDGPVDLWPSQIAAMLPFVSEAVPWVLLALALLTAAEAVDRLARPLALRT